jgi:hypothetical protein
MTSVKNIKQPADSLSVLLVLAFGYSLEKSVIFTLIHILSTKSSFIDNSASVSATFTIVCMLDKGSYSKARVRF